MGRPATKRERVRRYWEGAARLRPCAGWARERVRGEGELGLAATVSLVVGYWDVSWSCRHRADPCGPGHAVPPTVLEQRPKHGPVYRAGLA